MHTDKDSGHLDLRSIVGATGEGVNCLGCLLRLLKVGKWQAGQSKRRRRLEGGQDFSKDIVIHVFGKANVLGFLPEGDTERMYVYL